MSVKPRVLFVDDELDLVEIASAFFEDEGLPLDTSSAFNEALEKIRKNRYEVIITDANMPEGSGQELIAIIRAEGFAGKVILVSGNTPASPDHYDKIVLKPINFAQLISDVKNFLSK